MQLSARHNRICHSARHGTGSEIGWGNRALSVQSFNGIVKADTALRRRVGKQLQCRRVGGGATHVDFLVDEVFIEIDGRSSAVALAHRNVDAESQQLEPGCALGQRIGRKDVSAQPVKASGGRGRRHTVAGNCKGEGGTFSNENNAAEYSGCSHSRWQHSEWQCVS